VEYIPEEEIVGSKVQRPVTVVDLIALGLDNMIVGLGSIVVRYMVVVCSPNLMA